MGEKETKDACNDIGYGKSYRKQDRLDELEMRGYCNS